ncbi:MAG: MarR family winged helix-turn-helix transcriptional regulator [Sphingopyxis sp.]
MVMLADMARQNQPMDEYGLARLRVAASPLFLREAEVQRGVALLLLGQSHLLRVIDGLLRDAGIGRAHYRMLGHVVAWQGLALGDLVELTGTTKQSLSRVARELCVRGLATVRAGTGDRRRREYRPTDAGVALNAALEGALQTAMADAYAGAGQDAVSGYWRVLEGLVPVGVRMQIADLEKSRG